MYMRSSVIHFHFKRFLVLFGAGKPFGVDIAVAAEVLDAFSGDLDEVTDAAGGEDQMGELRVHDFSALGLADGGFDTCCGKILSDGHEFVFHGHDARAAIRCVVGNFAAAVVGVISLDTGFDQTADDFAEMNFAGGGEGGDFFG